jgi:hypothetical protein
MGECCREFGTLAVQIRSAQATLVPVRVNPQRAFGMQGFVHRQAVLALWNGDEQV